MGKENTYKESGILLLEKGKKGMLHMVFGRFGIVLISLMVQFLILFGIFSSLGNYIHIVFGGVVLIYIAIVIYLLNTEDNASAKITWLILFMILPVLGAFLYIFTRLDVGHRAVKKRLMNVHEHTEKFMKDDEKLLEALRIDNKDLYNLAMYIRNTGSYPIYQDTKVTYFPMGEDKFEELIKQIEKAKDFIFLEYFIIDEGYMWGRILNILAKKVQEGVEVRVMYDGTCEFARLPSSYPKKLRNLGIKCKVFFPILPMASTLYNYRDHRKILVVDGKVAFTGGVNLADEYINKRTIYGHWKDTAIMLEGPAVESFTMMFLQMWNVDERYEDDYKYWLSPSNDALLEQDGENQVKANETKEANLQEVNNLQEQKINYKKALGYVIPYGDDPLDGEHVGEMVYMDILNQAKDYVYMMTPYLILDGEMETALMFAAKRGIKVKLILPHIPDKKYAFALALTHYKALLEAGVQIYEYTPGFVHAKTLVCDDEKGVVGTINLDYRSLYHHFECATYLYKVPEIQKIKQDIETTLEQCQQMTIENYKKGRVTMLVMGKLLKVLAPLM